MLRCFEFSYGTRLCQFSVAGGMNEKSRGISDSLFQRFQPMGALLCCLGACGEAGHRGGSP